MLYVDTREHGNLPDTLVKLPDVKKEYMEYGDYKIDTKTKEPILIERKAFDDFISSIKSHRLDTQIEGCLSITDNVILLIEGNTSNFSKMPYTAYVAKIASLSQRGVQVIQLKNDRESFVFLTKLLDIHLNGHKSQSHGRVSPPLTRKMTLQEQAIWMLQGIQGIGPKTAANILDAQTISDILLKTDNLTKYEKLIQEICKVSLAGFEPATCGLEVHRAIQTAL